MTSRDARVASCAAVLVGGGVFLCQYLSACHQRQQDSNNNEQDLSVLSCIRHRRSVFPSGYLRDPPTPAVSDAIVQSLLDAALWGPFHGKCFAGCQHPAKFVVLGKTAMVEMQHLTLDYYDKHWRKVGWGSETHTRVSNNDNEYQKWRNMTEDEITGRWGPCSHMIAIVMRRQSGPKRLPEWEETAAVAASVQNMHIQACAKFPRLACYWSSWHDAFRDSDELKEYLQIESEDKCMGFFILAQVKKCNTKDRRHRDRTLMQVEWRP